MHNFTRNKISAVAAIINIKIKSFKMNKKYFSVIFILLTIMNPGLTSYAQNRSEKLLSKIDMVSYIKGSLVISPGCTHIAFMARSGYNCYVITDGKDGNQFENLGKNSLIFSNDGKRCAYLADSAKQWYAVIDGIQSKKYDAIIENSLGFSDDGKRVVYEARLENKSFVILDGIEGKPYNGVAKLILVRMVNGQPSLLIQAINGL